MLRGLQPSEDRVMLAGWNKKLRRVQGGMKLMGENLAWGQLRSGGRDGSATADEMIAFGHDGRWKKPLLEAAEHCTMQMEKDWRDYAQTFDDAHRIE